MTSTLTLILWVDFLWVVSFALISISRFQRSSKYGSYLYWWIPLEWQAYLSFECVPFLLNVHPSTSIKTHELLSQFQSNTEYCNNSMPLERQNHLINTHFLASHKIKQSNQVKVTLQCNHIIAIKKILPAPTACKINISANAHNFKTTKHHHSFEIYHSHICIEPLNHRALPHHQSPIRSPKSLPKSYP